MKDCTFVLSVLVLWLSEYDLGSWRVDGRAGCHGVCAQRVCGRSFGLWKSSRQISLCRLRKVMCFFVGIKRTVTTVLSASALLQYFWLLTVYDSDQVRNQFVGCGICNLRVDLQLYVRGRARCIPRAQLHSRSVAATTFRAKKLRWRSRKFSTCPYERRKLDVFPRSFKC